MIGRLQANCAAADSGHCAAHLVLAILVATGLVARPAVGSGAEAAVQFEAIWPDGTRETAPEIENWSGDGRSAAVAGRKLFSDKAVVRTLRNAAVPRRPLEGPLLEFIQGDVLPGRVTGPESEDALASQSVLLVQSREPVDLPGAEPRDTVRVHSEWIRRLVWTRDVREEFRPGTAFRPDGSSLTFQRSRFHRDRIHLLTENGIVTVGWSELAELHFPVADWWSMHAREQAVLAPDLRSPLVRIASVAGLRLTTSLPRLQIWSRSQRPALKDAFVVVQPAWCGDVLCVNCTAVRQYACAMPLEIPLSCIEPSRSVHAPIFSRLLSHWARDATVTGGPLVSGGHEYAWGIGTFGGHQLEFPIHSAALRFTTRVGVDLAAGQGGSLRGRIEWAAGGSPGSQQVLQETEMMIGASREASLVSAALPRGSGPIRLRLASDPLIAGAPPDADRFDIRDFCDWLEPNVELGKEGWSAAVTAAAPVSYPSLAGWTIDGVAGRDWIGGNLWDATTRPYPTFHRVWVLPGFPLSLKRTISVPRTAPATWMVHLHLASRGSAACRLEAFVNQRQVAKFALPAIIPAEPARPLSIDLTGFAGREMQVELRLVPLAGQTTVVWEGAGFQHATEQNPR